MPITSAKKCFTSSTLKRYKFGGNVLCIKWHDKVASSLLRELQKNKKMFFRFEVEVDFEVLISKNTKTFLRFPSLSLGNVAIKSEESESGPFYSK